MSPRPHRYKSWSSINNWLTDTLCDELKGRITYFFTIFRQAHDQPHCAAILLDGKELVRFKWINMYEQEYDDGELIKQGVYGPSSLRYEMLKPKWDEEGTYSGNDFIYSVMKFHDMPIADALVSEDYIVKILAILDKRVGKRTLEKIREAGEYQSYPDWVRQFYELRLSL